jgi:hypothetical protein
MARIPTIPRLQTMRECATGSPLPGGRVAALPLLMRFSTGCVSLAGEG